MIYIGIFLFSLLSINFFFRVIRLSLKLNKLAYSEETIHNFRCTKCNDSYTLKGPEAKRLIKGAIEISKLSSRYQTTFYIFNCPNCGTNSKQEKLFDLNVTKLGGALRIQLDSKQVPLILDFLLKGLLPVIVGFPISILFQN